MNKKPTCILYSPVSSYSGYGGCGRGIAKSLIELYKNEWDIKIIPCNWGALPTTFIDDHEEWKWLKEYYLDGSLNYKPNIMIWHTIPTEATPIGDYSVLFTAGIETDVCAPQWIEAINKLDLIIVPSEHSKTVFENSVFAKQDKNTNQQVGEVKLEKSVVVLHEGFIEDIYRPIKWI